MDIWDEILVDEMKKGNSDAFEKCYILISPKLYTVIYKVWQNKSSSEELLQDTFLDILENIHTYNREQSFIAWAKRIAFNNTINALKKYNRMELTEELQDSVINTNGSLPSNISDGRLLDSIMEKLTKVERLVLWLFIVEQYSHEEIAELVSKSSSYSKSIVSRVLKRIKLSKEVIDYEYTK